MTITEGNGGTRMAEVTVRLSEASSQTVTVSINDLMVTEGNTGSTTATFTVTLSAASNQDVTVHYQTANG
ncbi:MAG TPA: hypothetical protein VM490_00570, partial [Armatimonadaceae bacterium]|nr:hypothetical protein [Armatimonadaceae bacterium]